MKNISINIRNTIAFLLPVLNVLLIVFFFDPIVSPLFGISILASILTFIVLVKKKNNLTSKIGAYILVIGAFLAFLMLTFGEGTGNMEGWEIVFAAGIFYIAELAAIVSYAIGFSKSKKL